MKVDKPCDCGCGQMTHGRFVHGHNGRRAVEVRFFEKVEPEPMSGCWIWIGARHGDEYGTIRFDSMPGKYIGAHRLAYMLLRGPIPPELEPDHLCRLRCCVNPSHLELVTRRNNYLRGSHPSAETHRTGICANGHEKHGRRCGVCDRAGQRRRRQTLRQA